MTKICHLDYEGRSGVDITDVGAHRFSIDPRFEILCAAVSRDDDPAERVYLWVNPLFICPDMPGTDNAEAEKIIAEADIIYAHSAPNEMANTWGALQQGKNCPFKTEPSHKIWRCTAAMARKAGLPNALDDLCEALSVRDPKDRRGKALINLFCKPDEDTNEFVDPRSKPEEWAAFGEYCVQDVRAETACGNKLKPFELSGAALETFQFDLRMNQRGIPINVKAARYAQRIIDDVQRDVKTEFRRILGINPTQRDKFIKWMAANCQLELPNTQAVTIDAEITRLEKEVTDPLETIQYRAKCERQLHILGLYQKVSYAAVKKIQTMLDCVCPDGRVRGAHMYYGAGTGRWSGKLLQPQNFKKTPKWMRDVTDEVYRHICRGVSADYIDRIYGDPLEMISGCIRHFIHHELEVLDGDFSAVEARIICWLAGQDDILEMWRKGEDLYKWMASHVYNIPISQVDADQREVGKRIILGCFSAETQVLTSRGLKPIVKITSRDWLWDGVDWVRSDGVVYRGCKKTLTLAGVNVTPDHSVLCEKTWKRADNLVQDGATRSRALATALGSLLSPASGSGSVGEFSFTEFNALADHALTTSTRHPFTGASALAVIAALRSNPAIHVNDTGAMPTSCQTTLCANVFSTAFLAALPAATVKRISSFITTVAEEYLSTSRGLKTGEGFSAILSRLLTMTKLQEILTGRTPTKDTSQGIFASRLNARTSTIAERSQKCRSVSKDSNAKLHVYDVANAGPRNRFTIWTDNGPLIVHNCGFQMGWEKFQSSCRIQYQLELSDEICQKGVKLFRQLCKKITTYWYFLNDRAKDAIRTGGESGPFRIRNIGGIKFLLFKLRSGRSLAYPHPKIELVPWTPKKIYDEFGDEEVQEQQFRENITYWGQIPGSGQWGRIKLYGGKLAENETQATAADFMAHGAINAEKKGMEPFMLVHDQGLALRNNGQTVKEYEAALGDLPGWARGFPMKVEAKIALYYKK